MKQQKTLNLSLPELSFPPEPSNGDEVLSGTKRKFAFETDASNESFSDTAASHWFDFDSFSKCTASTVESSVCGYSSSSSWLSLFQSNITVERIAVRKTSHKLENQTTPSTAQDEITRQEQAQEQQSESSIHVQSTPSKLLPKELRDYCRKGSYWMEPTTKRRRSASRFSREELCRILEEEERDFSTISTQHAPKPKARRSRTSPKSSRSSKSIGNKIKSEANPLRRNGIRGRWSWIVETQKKQRKRRQKPATERPKKVWMPASVVGSSSVNKSRDLKALQDHCRCGEGSYWVEPTGRRRHVSPAYYDDNEEENRKKEKRQVLALAKSNQAVCINSEQIHSCNVKSKTSDTKNYCAVETKNQEKEIVKVIHSRRERTSKAGAPLDCKRTNNISEKRPLEITIKPKATMLDLAVTHKIHQHVVFRAVQGSNRPIDQYALDLISLVCNNMNHCKSIQRTKQEDSGNIYPSYSYQEAHHILDTPPLWRAIESEKERLQRLQVRQVFLFLITCFLWEKQSSVSYAISGSFLTIFIFLRLQLRQRFASATSIGMSPVDFSKKLLALWGGRLEQSQPAFH